MAFSDMIAAVDHACLSIFGDSLDVAFYPAAGGGPIAITAISVTPQNPEDYLAGGMQGVTWLPIFVRFVDISPLPQKGDVFKVNGVTYDMPNDAVDLEGGAVLKLRRNV